ncbi:hypothetical protein CANCADRAFT_31446 [Tortispora caseinolytica NRRL Y-17796]|uniref:DNA repair protein RAD16 n=1 Tax=Tortispora caseinolytica NRRL Y-17796 TaxID=767744 RepID=A0A1E4TFH1_9ASCO|nr:hypothetical protein CANCADRAFT_31446 [Tortispora caseinolytica NRRL Y-17796]
MVVSRRAKVKAAKNLVVDESDSYSEDAASDGSEYNTTPESDESDDDKDVIEYDSSSTDVEIVEPKPKKRKVKAKKEDKDEEEAVPSEAEPEAWIFEPTPLHPLAPDFSEPLTRVKTPPKKNPDGSKRELMTEKPEKEDFENKIDYLRELQRYMVDNKSARVATFYLYRQHPQLLGLLTEEEPREPVVPIDQPKDIVTPLLPFQREGVAWLLRQERDPKYKGGILADEMGMGKTIQMIALFATEPRRSPNLVICPTVALIQWKNEIAQHTGGKLKTLIHYGAKRDQNNVNFADYDVVLTTYATIESSYRKQQSGTKRRGMIVKAQSSLHNTKFERIVLDEAHNVKSRANNTTRAVIKLEGESKFCLSGTPLQNRIGELYSLIRFMKIYPYAYYFCRRCSCEKSVWGHQYCDKCGCHGTGHNAWFMAEIQNPIQRATTNEDAREPMVKLHRLLKQISLRRTKIERSEDLGLPPRIVRVRKDFFSPEELDFYRSIYDDSRRQFDVYANKGVVLNNYANIFTLIMRMRQVADHPDLCLRSDSALAQGLTEVEKKMICRLCDEEAEEPIESKCHHVFCRACITNYVESFDFDLAKLQCPVCHVGLSIDLEAPALIFPSEFTGRSIVDRIDMSRWRSSTKIEALVEELYRLRSKKVTIKSIVFSQFTNMLDLVDWRLKRAGFETVRLQGGMTPTQRDNSIKYFMNNVHAEVFLVSLKAGGVALNLCEASQVFIMDPWWNPSVEWQSGDRVHRIGQYRPVRITRLIIEDSIESRIVELQEKKANMIQATLAQDEGALNRLTPADMQFLFSS